MLLTASFMADFTTNLRAKAVKSYEARLRNLWWTKVASQTQSQTKREILGWLVNNGALSIDVSDGSTEFEDAVMNSFEFTHDFENKGLSLFESDFEDLDGQGINAATKFVTDLAAQFAYEPQRRLAKAMLANPVCYDGQTFFHASAHPVSGRAGDTSMGTYGNIIASKPIDVSVSIDVARTNLGAAIAAASAIKGPDGSPRNLQPTALLVPGALSTRALDLVGAKFLNATDHTPVAGAWNLGLPLVASELGAAFGGSDTTYYLVMTDPATDDFGGFVWSTRKDFAIRYPSLSDSTYQEQNLLKWVARGRHAIVPGHPYALIRVTG
ncbi:MAG: Mu-like prophage major head subunit gpT family protein [Deltaproteobacteria bacterium]|nr:Mu-like prophage major head subunit gpT family protein [Deltaproteobacteria bacterium]